ncbi:MAG: macrolide ABC transporter ATP-binding protein, partial [Lysobacterales bacterium CG_4_9_14_3_um_filter_62_6]
MSEPLLRLEAICKSYVMASETVHALNGINLSIARNQSIAFV